MGQAKNEYLEHLEEVTSAKEYLVERGLLNRCDRHDNIFGDPCGPEEDDLLAAADGFHSS